MLLSVSLEGGFKQDGGDCFTVEMSLQCHTAPQEMHWLLLSMVRGSAVSGCVAAPSPKCQMNYYHLHKSGPVWKVSWRMPCRPRTLLTLKAKPNQRLPQSGMPATTSCLMGTSWTSQTVGSSTRPISTTSCSMVLSATATETRGAGGAAMRVRPWPMSWVATRATPPQWYTGLANKGHLNVSQGDSCGPCGLRLQ